jgi:TolA-binding protein
VRRKNEKKRIVSFMVILALIAANLSLVGCQKTDERDPIPVPVGSIPENDLELLDRIADLQQQLDAANSKISTLLLEAKTIKEGYDTTLENLEKQIKELAGTD